MSHIIMYDKPDSNKVEQGLIQIVQKHFDFPLKGRITVKADVHHFNIEQDMSVWLQAKGKREHMFEAYWDDTWVCDFNTGFSAKEVEHTFMKGFLEQYQTDKIHLNTPDKWQEIMDRQSVEKVIDKAIKEQQEIKKETEEDHLSSNVIVELLEDKKEKVKKTRKKMVELYGEL